MEVEDDDDDYDDDDDEVADELLCSKVALNALPRRLASGGGTSLFFSRAMIVVR